MSSGITDYRQVLIETLRFPAQSENLSLLFTIGIIFNYLAVVNDGSQGTGLLLAIPSLIFFGYLAAVGAEAAQGAEHPPAFPLDLDGLKRLLRDGLKPIAALFMIIFPAAILGGLVMTPFAIVFGDWVMEIGATIIAAPIFVLMIVFMPAVMVHSGIGLSFKETITKDSIMTVLDLVTTKAYLESLVGFAVLLVVANAIGDVIGVIPIIGGVLGAAVIFYAQLAAFYMVGNVYGTVVDSAT